MCPINMHQLYQYSCYPLRVILCNLMLPRHPLVLAVRLRTFCLQSGLKRPPICPPRKQFIRQAPHRVEKSYGVTNFWAHAFPAPFRSPTRFLLPFHTRARCEFFFVTTHASVLRSLSIEDNVTSRSFSPAHSVVFSPPSAP
jgi:hypothetical protein